MKTQTAVIKSVILLPQQPVIVQLKKHDMGMTPKSPTPFYFPLPYEWYHHTLFYGSASQLTYINICPWTVKRALLISAYTFDGLFSLGLVTAAPLRVSWLLPVFVAITNEWCTVCCWVSTELSHLRNLFNMHPGLLDMIEIKARSGSGGDSKPPRFSIRT